MVRLVLVTGDKGGVGKSFTSRTLLDWYLGQGATVHAFDTDKTNSTLYRFYQMEGAVKQLDVENPADLDELLNLLGRLSEGASREVVLLDCAARTLDAFLKWMRDIGFMDLKRDLGFQMTLAFVLGPEKDCITILKDAATQFGGDVDYVVIKNLAKSSNFDLYQGSNTRKLLVEQLGAAEIELPALLEKTTLLLDRHNLGFGQALCHEGIQLADRSRVRIFRERMRASFEGVGQKWM
jgi:hypothetical protein